MFTKYKMMEYAKVAEQLKSAKDKRKKLIEDALDGRTQKWLADKLGLDTTSLYHKIAGLMEFSQDELNTINETLGTDFKLTA